MNFIIFILCILAGSVLSFFFFLFVIIYISRRAEIDINKIYDCTPKPPASQSIKLNNPLEFENELYSLRPGICNECDLFDRCGVDSELRDLLDQVEIKTCLKIISPSYCYHKIKQTKSA